MVVKEPEREMRFGSYSHDGTIQIQHVATFTDSRYLPSFAVTTTGTMLILPTFWLSQMRYSVTILPYERGFNIIDSHTQDAVYEGIQHTDKFLYLLWDFLRKLRPTFDLMRTLYEAFEGKPPNLDEIFKFILGQIVTVTKLSDQRCKTDHNLAGIASMLYSTP